MINPIGNANLQFVQSYINEILAAWSKLDAQVKKKWPEVISFGLKACDYLVRMIEKVALSGPDKKATVIAALSAVYDIVIAQSLPLYLKPFNTKIKEFVFGVIVSAMIDYIVSKYNEGAWNPQPTEGGSQ